MREIVFPLVCDTCRQTINDVSEAMVEWIREDRARDVRIIHHNSFSPVQPDGNCYAHSLEFNFADTHLQRVLDDYELMQSLGLVRYIRVLDISDL